MTELNNTVREKTNIPYHLLPACVLAVGWRKSRGLWLRALRSPPFWQFSLQQDTQSSAYNHFLLFMAVPNITVCENTNICYHLRPRCMFALRTTNATRSDARTLQPP
jgi:hypothetical protein